MNKKIKKLWVDALKSGEYEQGQAALYEKSHGGDDKEKYCCLGVLCDLHAKAKKKKSFNKKGQYLGEDLLLPLKVVKWAEFDEKELVDYKVATYDGLNVRAGNKTLSELNDHGKSFKQIAEKIEKYL